MIANIKLVYVGDHGTGKSAINHKFMTGQFETAHNCPTIGVIYNCKELMPPAVKVPSRVSFWDTAGQERFRSVIPMYYRGSAVVMIVFDLSNRRTYESVINYWIKEIQHQSHIAVYLVGNKHDLVNQRAVTKDEAQSLANINGYIYRETSAKNDRLEPLLIEIVNDVNQKIQLSGVSCDRLGMLGITLDQPKTTKLSACC
jgi:Ras-related protein Rab-8A